MPIYTKKGDKGTTTLLSGERVPKDDPRLEAYGTVDEVLSYLGLVRDLCHDPDTRAVLLEIQRDLMTLTARLAASGDLPSLPALQEERILFLEKEIDRMSATLPPLKSFIVPGGDPLASHCHIARTLCRRAERRVIPLLRQQPSMDRLVRYLNRLSDYLFMLAREVVKRKGGNEIFWKSED